MQLYFFLWCCRGNQLNRLGKKSKVDERRGARHGLSILNVPILCWNHGQRLCRLEWGDLASLEVGGFKQRKRLITHSRELSLGHGENMPEDKHESHMAGYASSQAEDWQRGRWKRGDRPALGTATPLRYVGSLNTCTDGTGGHQGKW